MKNKVLIYKPKDIIKANRLIGEFMGFIFVDDYSFKKTEFGRVFDRGVFGYSSHWDALMPVVEKLEELGVHITINPHSCHIVWWYSKNKHTTFEGNSCGKWKEPRQPFDSIGGKFYSRDVGVGVTAEKVNTQTKIEAVFNNVVYFLEWYKLNVKK